MFIEIVPNWSYFTPTVYRLMGRKYVDEFFQTGNLMLGSFKRFIRHEDEHRHDDEGNNVFIYRSPNRAALASTKHGLDSFVLCGTLHRPNSELMNSFNADAAIQIFDPTSFGNSIAKCIDKFRAGSSGPCFYSDYAIEIKVPDEDIESLYRRSEGQQPNLSDLGRYVINRGGFAPYFRKAEFFAKQFEYRWVWLHDAPPTDSVVLCVPEAREYCLPWYPEV